MGPALGPGGRRPALACQLPWAGRGCAPAAPVRSMDMRHEEAAFGVRLQRLGYRGVMLVMRMYGLSSADPNLIEHVRGVRKRRRRPDRPAATPSHCGTADRSHTPPGL